MECEEEKKLGSNSDELSSPPLDVSGTSDCYDEVECFVTQFQNNRTIGNQSTLMEIQVEESAGINQH